ncbi:MAG TPA: zinc-dependent metalloprotease [Puia sp.]|uniref:zinc-dependent metalloprotease n=1 Tax=Puia sp. TaxID=2045100 RepID=UPI002C6226B6|nr:zinc-dependent metalloprotease [Puia sp.]HVU94938.1 zinc-dependent metalloprotease [Puia sp.]
MKSLFPLFLAGLLGLISLRTIAQPICGFDRAHARQMSEDPGYRRNVEAATISIRNYIRQHPELLIRRNQRKTITGGKPHVLSSSYEIPVVVHVIHTGGDIGTIYNPTDAQITGAIDYLNQVYNGTWPGLVTTGLGAGDLGIQFVIAQRDPNCNPTNGINRIDGSSVAGYVSGGINVHTTLGTNEINIKNLSRWDNTQYYNVWIVNKIDGNDGTSGQFVAGYAYLPGAPSTIDGIVMLATQMVAGQKTLPHEIGHAFGLYHPFQGSTDVTQCPPATYNDCTQDGDQVCDTDPISENINSTTGVVDFTCRSGANSCAGGNPYTAATESNFMNYTNCFTLFTPGQAARLQAFAASPYRSSLTTSLGGTPPDAACAPKIDFQLQGDRHTETTAATAGCRSYKDYTYNMVIGTYPSAAAVATITVNSGGTATQGIDFDITTNGSFSSPSQQLTFPAGSTASQPFTIRVYDDASLNGARSAVLAFSVNNGGGNAIAGDGRPTFTLTIDDNDIAPYGPTTVTASIGTSQGTITGPFQASQTQNKSQILYYASELTAQGIKAGSLSAIALDIAKNSGASFSYQGFTIKFAATTQSSLYNGSTEFPISEASFTTVYSGNTTTVNGWNNFTLTTPFNWNGTSNIVVELCYSNAITSSDDNVQGYIDGSGNINYIWNPISCGSSYSMINYYGGGIKPIIRLTDADPGTFIQTALNSSQSQYLGPNADVYFYDATNGQLMARIQNLSSFDYGCTQVVIDRAGTTATQFWNTNTANYLMDKTFHVIPTTNNSSGSYNITLYYTQAEVQGWQTATTQTLSAIQLVKVPGQISSVTPAAPNAAGTPTIVTPTISALGTNTGLTYNFTNGFSGFGAGVPSLTVLPVTLLDFTGRLNNNDAVLSWSTSGEQNSARFEVDRSYDGQHFTKIGYVPAAGASSTQKDYTFTDPSLAADSNYYQLKEISLDGHATYSKIVLVRDPHAIPSFTVLPNPFTTSLDIVFGHVPDGPVRVRILDITGRLLWQRSGVQSDGSRAHLGIDGATLAPGIYILEVRSTTGVETQRILHE